MRKIFYLPSLLFILISLIYFFLNNYFSATLWLMLSLLFLIIFLPIILDLKEKITPALQIFAVIFLFLIFFSIFAFADFKNANFSIGKALVSGISIGSLTLIAIALLSLFRKSE